jgi:hypothetical protein
VAHRTARQWFAPDDNQLLVHITSYPPLIDNAKSAIAALQQLLSLATNAIIGAGRQPNPKSTRTGAAKGRKKHAPAQTGSDA